MDKSDNNLPGFSVLMSTWAGDDAEFLSSALQSVLNQTLCANEIVLVKDGPCSEPVNNAIEAFCRDNPQIRVISLEENLGLGAALNEGLSHCRFEIVARMDADDISHRTRFEKQLDFLIQNPDIEVVSSFLAAFDVDVYRPLFVRRGPVRPDKIAEKFRFRFCINHAASMFRARAVINAGGYKPFDGLEDYHLWARMILKGSKMASLNEVLYYQRWSDEVLKRRSGLRRAARQIHLQREFLKMGFVNHLQFVRNIIVRVLGCLVPQRLIRKIRIKFGI